MHETLRADAYRYATLAWNLANQGTYSDSTSPPLEPHMRWPPGYPALLAPFFVGRDLRPGAQAALAVQVLVGSTLPVLVVVLGRRMLPAWAAWLAGVLTAACPVLVTTPAFLVTESDFTVLLFLALLLFARLLERPTNRGAALAGLLSGALGLVRSSALGVPLVVGGLLAARRSSSDHRRAAVLLVIVAAAVAAPWQIRNRIQAARGVPAPSYFAGPLAEGIYPDLTFGNSLPGYAFTTDPRFAEFSTSIGKTLAELWARTRADPWPNLRWNLYGRWLTLWEFEMIQSPPIHIYPVRQGLFRPEHINPAGTNEPLAAFYWIFRGLPQNLWVDLGGWAGGPRGSWRTCGIPSGSHEVLGNRCAIPTAPTGPTWRIEIRPKTQGATVSGPRWP